MREKCLVENQYTYLRVFLSFEIDSFICGNSCLYQMNEGTKNANNFVYKYPNSLTKTRVT